MRTIAYAFTALALALAASAAAQPVAIVGAKVHTVSGAVIENATVVITGDTITAVGAGVRAPAGARVIDGKGKWVTPGLINSAAALGLTEVGSLQDTNDASARGDRGVAATFKPWEAINPESVLWAPTRNEGVTSVVEVPSGGVVSGQAAVVDTAGTTVEELLRKAPVAFVLNFGATGGGGGGGAGGASQGPTSRAEALDAIRALLTEAKTFPSRKGAYEAGNTRALVTGGAQLEALQPVVSGTALVLVNVDRAADIRLVLGLAKEFGLKIAIAGGAEAWKVASELAAAKVPVVTGALDNLPADFSSLGATQENAALLRKAGVPVILTAGTRETFNVRKIRQHAGNAVAYGLPWAEALRAVTLTPAEVFGVADQIGSIAEGKVANLVVWSGDPFEFATDAEHVFVKGREVQGPSRQDQLAERYKTGKRGK